MQVYVSSPGHSLTADVKRKLMKAGMPHITTPQKRNALHKAGKLALQVDGKQYSGKATIHGSDLQFTIDSIEAIKQSASTGEATQSAPKKAAPKKAAPKKAAPKKAAKR